MTRCTHSESLPLSGAVVIGRSRRAVHVGSWCPACGRLDLHGREYQPASPERSPADLRALRLQIAGAASLLDTAARYFSTATGPGRAHGNAFLQDARAAMRRALDSLRLAEISAWRGDG